jgi:valyl-tRNA synthetase
VQKLYDFVWDILCDWYIEIAKPRLLGGGQEAVDVRRVLVYVFTETLALLHPFLPFITEELWQAMPHDGEALIIASWPTYDEKHVCPAETADFEMVMDAIRAIRNARTNADIPPSRKATVHIASEHGKVFTDAEAFIKRLAYASNVIAEEPGFTIERAMNVVTDAARIFIPMDELIDRDKEMARLMKEKASCERDIENVNKKLENENFVSRAPEKVIENERQKLAKATERLVKIEESIKELG